MLSSISIHLMLMLIILRRHNQCYQVLISIHLMLMLIPCNVMFTLLLAYFNTSHVNVNQFEILIIIITLCHFNTSHVNVNPDSLIIIIQARIDFNTSHVNVNPMNLSLFQSRLNLSLPILSHFLKNYQPISLFLTMGLISLLPQIFTGLLEIFFINCLVNTCII